MLWSRLFIPTLREDPADISSTTHRLLIRAGYMRKHDYLFLGRRTLRKIVALIRNELDGIGAQEFLASSHMTLLALSHEIRSYKQLPQIWYQVQGFMVEGCGLGLDQESRQRVSAALKRILDRCEVRESVNTVTPPVAPDPAGDLAPEEFHTPGQKTIADIAAFTGLPETSQMKSVVMIAIDALGDAKPVLALLRGDHHLDESKLQKYLLAKDLRAARPEEIRETFGADAGSLGPISLNKTGAKSIEIICDQALEGGRNLICGANRNDYHLRNVTPGEDFAAEFADLSVESGVKITAHWWGAMRPGPLMHIEMVSGQSPLCSLFTLAIDRLLHAAIEPSAQDSSCAIQSGRDKDGIVLSASIAPFEVVITPVNIADDAQRTAAHEIYNGCLAAGLDALLDDRDERPGVKFKDSDLIGIPYRITVGMKLPQGLVELVSRQSMVEFVTRRGRESSDVSIKEAAASITARIASNRE